MVATTFAGMAMDAIEEGKHGLMTAISNGCYALVPIPDPKLGPRHVEVATMYNTERYRPVLRPQAGPADLPDYGYVRVVSDDWYPRRDLGIALNQYPAALP
jgi:hypothetical protein